MNNKRISVLLFFLFLCTLILCQKDQKAKEQSSLIQIQKTEIESFNFKISDDKSSPFQGEQNIGALSKEQQLDNQNQRIANEVLEQTTQPWYVIVLILVGGVMLTVIAIVLYKKVFAKHCCQQNWYYAPLWIEMIPQQLSHQFYSEYLRFLDAEDLCSICLTGKCDSITSCGHIYHLQCILLWLKTDKNCPNCKKEEFSLKYFCWSCKKTYCHLDDMEMIEKCSPYLKQFPKCDRCYQKQLKEEQKRKPEIGIKQFPGDSQKQQIIMHQSQENLHESQQNIVQGNQYPFIEE